MRLQECLDKHGHASRRGVIIKKNEHGKFVRNDGDFLIPLHEALAQDWEASPVTKKEILAELSKGRNVPVEDYIIHPILKCTGSRSEILVVDLGEK
jgi:hypothetical protein